VIDIEAVLYLVPHKVKHFMNDFFYLCFHSEFFLTALSRCMCRRVRQKIVCREYEIKSLEHSLSENSYLHCFVSTEAYFCYMVVQEKLIVLSYSSLYLICSNIKAFKIKFCMTLYFSFLHFHRYVSTLVIYWHVFVVFAVISFRSDLSDEPTESDSGSDYSDEKRSSSRYSVARIELFIGFFDSGDFTSFLYPVHHVCCVLLYVFILCL